MSEQIRTLEPTALWNHFADLNAVPRPSKKEERVIQFMVDFANGLDLDVLVDEVGNVIISKPATPGMEDRAPVVLQAHLDMVHQKNSETVFDFDSEGIRMYVEGDWVKAKGTTLGSDNGIGVAMIMAVLSSTDIPHPPLQGLFTIDEETGMTGAKGLKEGLLKGEIMLNLDTEDDDELTIGCAGGIDVTAAGEYETEDVPEDHVALKVSITGLKGGHSGGDIHIGRGNANKLMNRLLSMAAENFEICLASIDGGSLRNAIPRESFAVITVPTDEKDELINAIHELEAVYQNEYRTTDPSLAIRVEDTALPDNVAMDYFMADFILAVYACPNGVFRMSPDMPGLTQTSNNLARILMQNGQYKVSCLTRSSIDTEKIDYAASVAASFVLMDAEIELEGEYPGWIPRPDAPIIQVMSNLYEELFGSPAKVSATHGGLECGIIGAKYPDMAMISFGPNIRDPHSPDERCQISSVQKSWKYLLETLKRIPGASSRSSV